MFLPFGKYSRVYNSSLHTRPFHTCILFCEIETIKS